jgi:nitronate monooxygenase
VAEAGGLGMLSGTGGAAHLSAQLDALGAATPVGVNFLGPFLDRAALEDAAARTPLVELFYAEPDAAIVATIHGGGALAGWQVGSTDEARAAADAGCDLVIAQGVEAGGHVRGTIGLLALLDEVRAAIEVPVVAAGGISTGRALAAAIVAGADGVRVGTALLAATESGAHPRYVDALVDARAEDTVLTTAFGDGWPDAPHRVLRSCIDAGTRLGAAQSWSPHWPTEDDTGPVEARALYAGEGVGAVHARRPAAEILAELVQDAERSLQLPGR